MNNKRNDYHDKIDVSEGININKTSASKECVICHYWYFSNFNRKGFEFQLTVCRCCHDVLMASMNLNDIAVLNIHGAGCCAIISGISKSEAVNLLNNVDLSEYSSYSLLCTS